MKEDHSKKYRLSGNTLTKLFARHIKTLLEQPENQETNVDVVYETLERKNFIVSREMDLFLVTFRNRLTHIISFDHFIFVVADRPGYRTTLTLFKSGTYFLCSEHFAGGKRVARRLA